LRQSPAKPAAVDLACVASRGGVPSETGVDAAEEAGCENAALGGSRSAILSRLELPKHIVDVEIDAQAPCELVLRLKVQRVAPDSVDELRVDRIVGREIARTVVPLQSHRDPVADVGKARVRGVLRGSQKLGQVEC
jgi:hypothetical protein